MITRSGLYDIIQHLKIPLPSGRHRRPHRPSYPPRPSSLVVLLTPGRQRLITDEDIRFLQAFEVYYWWNNTWSKLPELLTPVVVLRHFACVAVPQHQGPCGNAFLYGRPSVPQLAVLLPTLPEIDLIQSRCTFNTPKKTPRNLKKNAFFTP